MSWTDGGSGPYRSLAGRLRDQLAADVQPTVPPPPSDTAVQKLRDALGPENRARGIYPQGTRTPITPYDTVNAIANTAPGFGALRRATQLASGIGTGRLTYNYANPTVEQLTTQLKNSGAPGMLTPEEQAALVPGRVSVGGALSSLAETAAAPARLLSKGIGELPIGGAYGVTPGGGIAGGPPKKVKNQDPATQFVIQSAPYILAPEAGGAMFFASLPATVKDQITAYQSGQITGKQLAGNLAMTLGPIIAPELAKLGIKGSVAIARYAKSPEGKLLINDTLRKVRQSSPEGGGGAPLNPKGEPVKPGEQPPRAISPHLASSYPVTDVQVQPSNTRASFTIGQYAVDVHARFDGREIDVSFGRIPAEGGAVTAGMSPRGTAASLGEVGRFLQDLQNANPQARITNTAANPRLFDVYKRLGFDPLPGGKTGREMQLNPERLAQVMGRRTQPPTGPEGNVPAAPAAEGNATLPAPELSPIERAFRNAPRAQGEQTYYHGTTDAAAADIVGNGPQGLIYGTPDLAEAQLYARQKARDLGGNPVVVSFRADPAHTAIGGANPDAMGYRLGFKPENVTIDPAIQSAAPLSTRPELSGQAHSGSPAQQAAAPLDSGAQGTSAAAGSGYTTGGGEPPVPSRPVATGGGGELPPQDIRSVMVEAVRQNRPLRESQAAPRSEQLAAKAAQIAGVRSTAGMTPAERAAALGKAASGELYKADFSPIQITPEQHAAAIEHVAANPNISEFDYLRLVGTKNYPGALDKLLAGQGLQKNEEALLTKAFGPQMADALQNRGTGSLEANITQAMQPPANLGPARSGVIVKGAMTPEQIYARTQAEVGKGLEGLARRAAKERQAILNDMANSIDQATTRPGGGMGLSAEQQRLASGEKNIAGSVNAAMANYHPIYRNKLWNTTLEALGIPRALQTTADLSAALRQGIVLAAGHPVRFGQAFVAQVKAMFSHDFSQAVQADITSHPDYALAQKAKLENIAINEKVLSKREEAYQSHLLNKVPGVRIITQASERAFLTFTNKLRHDVFYDQLARWRSQGVDLTDKRLSDLAHYLNNATGRGSLKWLGQHAATSSAVFYSPRFLVSRFQLAGDLLRPSQDPAVRQLVAKDLASFVGAGVTMLTLAKMAGADVQIDPRSTDFGKIRIGDTRIDFWAGFSPIARTVAQMASGEKLIEGTQGTVLTDRSRLHAFVQFLSQKTSPAVGALLQASGSSYPGLNQALGGQPPFDREMLTKFNADNPIIQNTMPLFFQDVLAAYQTTGPAGIGLGALSALGTGVQGYQLSEKSAERADKLIVQEALDAKGWSQLPETSWKATLNTHPALKTFGSYDEFATDYKAKRETYLLTQTNPVTGRTFTAAEAADRAVSDLQRTPAAQEFSRQLSGRKLMWYKQQPDLTRKGIEAGIIPVTEATQKIAAPVP